MKRWSLAALAGTAALMAGTAANALTFTYSGQIDSFTALTGGWYEIDAWGAQGGDYDTSLPNGPRGGLGAMVGGRIYLGAGQTLSVVVGGRGSELSSNTAGGGGGGSFVYVSSDLELLLAAGGGGGSGWLFGSGGPGLAGRTGGGVGGGVDGAGGTITASLRGTPGGGAGWLGSGSSGSDGIYGTGGSSGPSFQGGWTGGCVNECESGQTGGFGGGGGAAYNFGGGGGGYSGGGGLYDNGRGGGGGGSYIADGFYDFVGQSGVRSGNGLVSIDLLPIPEPATWAMMILGFFGLGSALRRRRQAIA